MRHLNIITTLIFLLGLLGASSASGAPANVAILMASSTNTNKTKVDTSDKISCVPQATAQQPSVNLWKCEDSYGNQFDNLIILKEYKNGNIKRARN